MAMPIDIVTVPCRTDNYAFLIHDEASGETALVDAPETAPILAALEARNWQLTDILITHHHYDHVEGVEDLRKAYGCRVVGAAADAARLPKLDLAVSDGDDITVCGAACKVIDVSGHTVGHIAFHIPEAKAAFTADSLMALGCGRLFEGTADQMWQSLSSLKALPADTMIYSGHEYTAANAKFAVTIEPENPALMSRVRDIDAARSESKPTVPSLLSEELATNPFLRADLPLVKAALNMSEHTDVAVFAEIRRRKDNF